ncbi:MAG TPA: hypothetical protein VFE37_19265 [Chloroflexota bacterium]|nr:hypothetical protein [Chloroflexota bacterium]
MREIADSDIQCLLCDRVVAEWRLGQLRLNPNYQRDARAALASRHCGHCGGRLVAMQVMAGWIDAEPPSAPFRRRSRAS